MSGRPADWDPLTEDGRDPLPGDWELVREAAARYRRTAEAIDRARVLLRDVTDSRDGWRSQAGEAFRETATELSDDVFRAHGRYEAAADALAGYWPVLREAQEESLDLRRQARQAQDEIDGLQTRVRAAEDEDSDTHDRLAALQDQVAGVRAELARLRERLAALIEEKDTAAQRAADALGEFIGGDGLEDGWRDRVGAVVSAALNAVGELAGQVAMAAGLASLLLCWVPVLGQALAAVATIATLVSLAVNVYQRDFRGILLDSLGLLTFGIGRAAGAAARAARGRGLQMAARSWNRTVRRHISLADRSRDFRRAFRMSPGEVMRAGREARSITRLAQAPIMLFGRSVNPGPLGWTRLAFREAGSELLTNLRAPFSLSNWSVAGSLRDALRLTDMGPAASAAAGEAAAAARRAGQTELGAIAAGTLTTGVTLNDDWSPQLNFPVPFADLAGESAIPFTSFPGLSLAMESPWPLAAPDGGAFSYHESEAAPR